MDEQKAGRLLADGPGFSDGNELREKVKEKDCKINGKNQ